MNMAQFANKAVGQPVTNWDVSRHWYQLEYWYIIEKSLKYWRQQPQASGTTLGFARGNVGFLALGDLGKEFYTGLPVNYDNNNNNNN